jgi:hypothetical protein
MSAENIGVLAGIIATFIAVITSIVILVRHFDKLENKVDRIRDGLNQNIRQSNNMLGLFSTLIGLLSKKGVIDQKEFGTIIKEFSVIGRITEVHPNPITLQQTDVLNGYIRRAQQGGTFTTPEVQEYRTLVARLEQEHPDDPDIMALVALAALLMGLYLLSKD